jgi:hypothetical protein
MQTTGQLSAARVRRPLADRAAVLAGGTAPFRLTAALAVVTVVTALPMLFAPSLLSGPDVMVGSARGTALVVLVLTVPVLLLAAHATTRGSARGLVVWLGAVAHLLYQSVLFLFATPLNSLFLLYVAMLGLSVWTVGILLVRTDIATLASRFSLGAPVRLVAGVLAVVAGLNTLLWLARVVPTIGDDDPAAVVAGTGLTTNPVIAQDLALWLPLALVAAAWLWQRRPVGHLAAASVLTLWTLEGVTVAVDQLFGYAMDPTTEWATREASGIFAVLTVITLVPLLLHLRGVDRDQG